MLTADLVPTYIRRGRVYPRYIDPRDPELLDTAAALLTCFQEKVGATRGELEEALQDFSGDSPLFFLHKGLIKLLLDRCEFQSRVEGDPLTIRRHVFQAAARRRRQGELPGLTGFDPAAVLAEAGAALGLTPAQVEAGLYADLASRQVLQEFAPLSPERLLERYNTALAQAILLRATRVHIRIAHQPPMRYRQLFRFIKFYQLLYRIAGSMEQGYEITLDGPLSLFQASQRYGVRLAQFLPVLLWAGHWTLTADLLWGPRRLPRRFELSSEQGLRSHYPDHGVWIPEEVQAFAGRFASLGSAWEVSAYTDLIELGKGPHVGLPLLCIPDFRFRHRITGRTFYLELFGFWRRNGVEERLAQLEAAGRRDILLAVGQRGRVSEEDLEAAPEQVYYFRGVMIPREVLQLLERVAATGLSPG